MVTVSQIIGYSFNQKFVSLPEALHNRNLPENLPFGKTVTAKAFFQSSQAKMVSPAFIE